MTTCFLMSAGSPALRLRKTRSPYAAGVGLVSFKLAPPAARYLIFWIVTETSGESPAVRL
jgi:hypothetical protein